MRENPMEPRGEALLPLAASRIRGTLGRNPRLARGYALQVRPVEEPARVFTLEPRDTDTSLHRRKPARCYETGKHSIDTHVDGDSARSGGVTVGVNSPKATLRQRDTRSILPLEGPKPSEP
ncbi:hypothetical protein KM043_004601 [Ampulex compressa]|nr:hypothetical protein KM043_004601 [Ampulex compressa]